MENSQMRIVDPRNARDLATTAVDAGAVVRAGPLRHLSVTDGWQLGSVDLGELLAPHHDQQVVLIVAPVEEAAAVLCEVCAYPLDAAGACPRCALRGEVAALRRVINAALRMREIEERLIWPGGETY
jgi:hypothetical protein